MEKSNSASPKSFYELEKGDRIWIVATDAHPFKMRRGIVRKNVKSRGACRIEYCDCGCMQIYPCYWIGDACNTVTFIRKSVYSGCIYKGYNDVLITTSEEVAKTEQSVLLAEYENGLKNNNEVGDCINKYLKEVDERISKLTQIKVETK